MSALNPRALVLVEDSEDDESLSLRGIDQSGVGCDVMVLRDGREALEYLLDPAKAVPELVVLDFRLPRISGIDILRKLRSDPRTKRVPIVILSSTTMGAELVDCYGAGANSCVIKPMDPHLYLERVSMIVRYWLDVNDPLIA